MLKKIILDHTNQLKSLLMLESLRLKELFDYKVLDTPPEKELDDIAYLASVICEKPVGIISLVDKDRNWFKAKHGTDMTQTDRMGSFCQHTFGNHDEVMIINDATTDERFKCSPLVVENPNIRFYAGAPLLSEKGYVLGALCVIDTIPGDLAPEKVKALKLLAEKAMDYLNTRKIILNQKNALDDSAQALKNLTDDAPGVLLKFQLSRQHFNLNFISKGVDQLGENLSAESLAKNPQLFLDVIYASDKRMLKRTLAKAAICQKPFVLEFRIEHPVNGLQWYLAKASAQKDRNGPVWYGTIQNITQQLEYQKAMEQISFDISHILRSPVTNLLGLSNVIGMERNTLTEAKLQEYSEYIQTVSNELDQFTRNLNAIYEEKKRMLFGRN